MMTGNRLIGETSPYLLQHKDNPVHWMPWGDEALYLARELDRPILLSIGYAACHWCHVMAHESFENPEIAKKMNNLFINIKIDREERPDVDSIYQNALALMGQQGGWPLTMFLAPDGRPFWGGTYYPAQAKWGMPAFSDILDGIAHAYKTKRHEVEQSCQSLIEGLNNIQSRQPGIHIGRKELDKISSYLLSQHDPVHGGLGKAPKFPQPTILRQLWKAGIRLQNEDYFQAVTQSLRKICQGGIYDHLAGGFSRYCVDERWLVPHFEKMLYDNAQLIPLLLQAWQRSKEPLFARRVKETIQWCLQDLRHEDGAFFSSYDADSDGAEGKFYVWSHEEITKILGPDADFFNRIYDVSVSGNWEGSNILNRLLSDKEKICEAEDEILNRSRQILLKARQKRMPPSLDDKILSDWNGMMIQALVLAGEILDRPDWIKEAGRAFAFICKRMQTDAMLFHSQCKNRHGSAALLEDYANMMTAALQLYENDPHDNYLAQAEIWAAQLDENFRDESQGGYYSSARKTPNLVTNQKHALDNAVPAGNSTLLGVFTRLFLLTGKKRYQARVEEILETFSGEIDRNFYPLSTFLCNAEFYKTPLQIILKGKTDKCKNLRLKIRQALHQEAIVITLSDDFDLPKTHPAYGKKSIENKPTVYICFGQTCHLPLTEEKEIFKHLQNINPIPV